MKGFADYMCEEIRREERRIERDIEKKERQELQEFIERTRREIAENEAWLRQEEFIEEKFRHITPAAMFYLLKRCGGVAALACFDFRQELKEIAAAMRLTTVQTATYILVAGLQRRCPCGVGPVHLARYTNEQQKTNAWHKTLSELHRLGLLSIAKQTSKDITYYKINTQ